MSFLVNMETDFKQIYTELVVLKTTVDLGFKNLNEKTDATHKNMAAHDTKIDLLEKTVAEVASVIKQVQDAGNERQRNAEEAHRSFVSKEEFTPVKLLVYGFAGLVLIAFIGGLITLVLKQ
jgi:hypothetical protein